MRTKGRKLRKDENWAISTKEPQKMTQHPFLAENRFFKFKNRKTWFFISFWIVWFRVGSICSMYDIKKITPSHAVFWNIWKQKQCCFQSCRSCHFIKWETSLFHPQWTTAHAPRPLITFYDRVLVHLTTGTIELSALRASPRRQKLEKRLFICTRRLIFPLPAASISIPSFISSFFIISATWEETKTVT